MATPEFEQTGSTSGQRMYREGADTPARRPPQMASADRFVSRVMANNPGMLERYQTPQPDRDTFDDLSDNELRQAYRQLGANGGLDPALAAEVSAFLQEDN